MDTGELLIDLFRACIVKIMVARGHGSGFFVAPQTILTCAHVLAGRDPQEIQIHWQNQNLSVQELTVQTGKVAGSTIDYPDLALLRVAGPTDHPCVLLDEAAKIGDHLYSFGYPDLDKYPHGSPVTFRSEGQLGGDPLLLKLKDGQARPGLSGAPLLNLRTSQVCGIVKRTRNPENNLGAYAVPVTSIWQFFPELRAQQEAFHSNDLRWHVHMRASMSDQPAPVFHLPHPRNPLFTGREDELHHLHEHFTQARTAALTQPPAITGLGGIGKTQIAVEYAHRYQQEYQYILWVNAANRETLIDGFVTLAKLLRLSEADEPNQQIIVTSVKNWLSTHDDWLLLLDNADDPATVADFLPSNDRGHLLLTSRDPAWRSLAFQIEVEKLSEQEGTHFLLRRAHILPSPGDPLTQVSAADQQLAAIIVRELDGLPLALDQAGAYIDENHCSIKHYLRVYRIRAAALLRWHGRAPTAHPDPVATTWSLNFQQVAQISPAAADLLSVLAFLAPDSIPEELFSAGAGKLGPNLQSLVDDETMLDELRGVLLRFSLVQHNPNLHLLFIHRLVQAILRESMPVETRREWMRRTVLAVASVFPEGSFEHWTTCERLLSHALQCATWIEQENLVVSEATRLLNYTGYYLSERGRYTEVEALHRQALTIHKQVTESQDEDTASSLAHLAYLYDKQGKYAQAEPLLQQALAIYEAVLGPEHPDTVQSLNNLASLYSNQKKYAQAESLFLRALAIYNQPFGLDHPHTTNILNNLGLLYDSQGKYAQAEPLLQQALAIRERVLGPEHPDTARSLNNLASLYSNQKKYAQAESLFLRALAIRERVLSPEHPDTLQSLNNLATLYDSQGKYAQAEPLLQRALAIYETVLGPEHQLTAVALNNLAMLYDSQGKYAQAELLYQRALVICEHELGLKHPDTAQSLNNLAMLYSNQDKYEQAEFLLKRALAIYETVLGAEHSLTACTLNNLAALYYKQGKYEQAEPLFQRALAIQEQVLGSWHPLTAGTLNNLAMLYSNQGKYEQAELLYRQAMAIWEQALGPKHPHIQTVRANYAAFLRLLDPGKNITEEA